MKVRCDVCGVEVASVFCCADEAALCHNCDRGIHGANKLAGKHPRISLLDSLPPPLCDICQEKRGFVLCQEDRAILCRDCDITIHTTNKFTMNHSRFLLTGVRLSSAPIPAAPPPEAELADNKSNNKEVKSESSSKESRENVVVVEEVAVCSSSSTTNTAAAVDSNGSSISEYLIKMLPGWHVEDFLTDDVATTVDAGGSCQANGDLLENSGLGGVAEGPPIWDTQAGGQTGQLFWGFVKEAKTSRQRWSEESLRVPQMSNEGTGNTRSSRTSLSNSWYS